MTERIPALSSVNTQLSIPIIGICSEAVEQKISTENCNQLQNTDVSADVAKYLSASLADNTRLAYRGDLGKC